MTILLNFYFNLKREECREDMAPKRKKSVKRKPKKYCPEKGYKSNGKGKGFFVIKKGKRVGCKKMGRQTVKIMRPTAQCPQKGYHYGLYGGIYYQKEGSNEVVWCTRPGPKKRIAIVQYPADHVLEVKAVSESTGVKHIPQVTVVPEKKQVVIEKAVEQKKPTLDQIINGAKKVENPPDWNEINGDKKEQPFLSLAEFFLDKINLNKKSQDANIVNWAKDWFVRSEDAGQHSDKQEAEEIKNDPGHPKDLNHALEFVGGPYFPREIGIDVNFDDIIAAKNKSTARVKALAYTDLTWDVPYRRALWIGSRLRSSLEQVAEEDPRYFFEHFCVQNHGDLNHDCKIWTDHLGWSLKLKK